MLTIRETQVGPLLYYPWVENEKARKAIMNHITYEQLHAKAKEYGGRCYCPLITGYFEDEVTARRFSIEVMEPLLAMVELIDVQPVKTHGC